MPEVLYLIKRFTISNTIMFINKASSIFEGVIFICVVIHTFDTVI